MKKTTLFLKGRWRAALLVLLLSAVGMTKGYADFYDVTIGVLLYDLNTTSQTASVCGHVNGTSATGELVIPESVTYQGVSYSVTSIEYGAFYNCSGLTGSLTIPNSVTAIRQSAFYGCSGLDSISIPETVTLLYESSFFGTGWWNNQPDGILYLDGCCLGYKGTKPTGTLQIAEGTRIIVPNAFRDCGGLTGSLTIPNSVTTIGGSAFWNCSGFTGSLTIGNSVTTIGDYAFYNCSGLNSINIPETVTSLWESSFYKTGWWNNQPDSIMYLDGCCLGYKYTKPTGTLQIVEGTRIIVHKAFYYCSGLTGSLAIPNSVTTIGQEAFEECSGFTGSLTIGNSLTTIGWRAFFGCSGLTGGLTIPNSVTTIGGSAFCICSGFTGDLILSNAMTEIKGSTFSGCSGLTGSLIIPNSVTTIGGSAFEGCSGLTGGLTIPNSVTAIGSSAFYGCSGFTGDLVIPNSVTSIDYWTFRGCSGLTGSLTIPNSVTTIGHLAFENCSGFTGSLTIPNSVTTIGNWAFEGCSGLTGSLTIGNSVTEIGVGAFLNCSGFASIQALAENVPATAGDAFAGVNHSIPITVPCGTLTSYQNATGWSEFTNYYEDCGDITQTTSLTSGWNWWSTYVEADDLFDQLTTGLGANASQIKSSTSFVNYFNGYWVGGLSSINNESCYLINANNACALEMTGNQATPADHPITINPNWNWVGYPNSGSMSVENAFSNITPTNGDQVKSQNAFATYYSGMWVGALSTITPGMGLLYKSNSTETMTLVYPESNRSENVLENVTNEDNHWTADYHAYPSNMTVMAVIELDDMELQGENYEIAAFANGECRGSARLMFVEPLNRYVAFLTIVGDEASELRFSLYDDETRTVETQDFASLQYETNAIVGSLETPYIVQFRSTTGIDERPNNFVFFNGNEWVFSDEDLCHDASLQIIDMMGRVIRCTDVARNVSTTGMMPGVYVLRLICNDTVRTQKIVIDK